MPGRKRLAFIVLTFVAAVSMSVDAGEVKPVLLRTPSAFATSAPGPGATVKWIAERLEAASNGSVTMRIYEPNKLIGPFEILDAVSSGQVNAGYSTASHWEGKMPAAHLFSVVPFGPETGEYLAWLWYGNGMTLYQQMYDRAGYKVKVLLCGVLPSRSSGWFVSEINGPDDLKDLRMRFFGLGAQVMQRLDVTVNPLPVGEILPALESGLIDAAEFSTPRIERRAGIHRLANYNYFPGWHHQASTLELLINMETWNRMHASQRALLDIICRAAAADSFAEGEAAQFGAMKDNVAKDGVKIRRWSDEMLALFEAAWHEVARDHAAKDAFFKKVWDDLSAFRAGYEIWKSNAFLPRMADR